MEIRNIPYPEIYRTSSDFRTFVDIFATALSKTQFDTENVSDCYDPLRCRADLLWMLAETMGYKFDDRLPTAFNRLVLVYFMSMIRNKGSKDGVTLAAEVNLSQFSILDAGAKDDIFYDRLEDTSVPVNSVSVNSHVAEGYIDVTYFSTDKPIDACIEYVRPLGMYVFERAGVRVDGRTKISVDAKLTDSQNIGMSIGPTHVGHYRRDDYARIQRMRNEDEHTLNKQDMRHDPFYRNSIGEGKPSREINPGYRALYSLQLCNNEHIVKSTLRDPIFSLGYGPQDVETVYGDDYLKRKDEPNWNLRLDRTTERNIDSAVYTNIPERTTSPIHARPAVNPIMSSVGDAISLNAENSKYTKVVEGKVQVVEQPDE